MRTNLLWGMTSPQHHAQAGPCRRLRRHMCAPAAILNPLRASLSVPNWGSHGQSDSHSLFPGLIVLLFGCACGGTHDLPSYHHLPGYRLHLS